MKGLLVSVACCLALAVLAPTASSHVAPPRDTDRCVTLYDFPDNGLKACVDAEDPSCTVYLVRTTFLGSEKDCVYPDAEGSAASSAAAPGAECMDIYRETHLAGPYWLVQRSSCQAQVYECPDGYDPPAPPCREASLFTTSAAIAPPDLSSWPKCAPIAVGNLCVSIYWPGCNAWIEWTAIPAQPTCLYRSDGLATSASAVQCMDVYSQTELVGGYWLVRRDSCSAQVYWCPAGHSPPAPPCEEAPLFATAATAPPDVDLPPIHCSDIYARHEVGPVAVVMTSGCSGHVELCDERVHARVDASCVAEAETPPIYCMPYERHLDVMPGLTVVQGGCGSYVLLCGQRVTTDPSSADPSCLGDPLLQASAAQEPMCMYYYHETTVGPVRHVQRDSCHSETYVCGETAKELTTTTPDPLGLVACTIDSLGLATTSAQPLPTVPPVPGLGQPICYRYGQFELWSVWCIQPNDPDCVLFHQQITGQGSSWSCLPSGESGSDW